jgi:tartronate-semialdehyde synthase
MPKMNVMDTVVRVMESEGVDVVFGVPGAAILPLYNALAKSDIRHVSVRHEEGGTHAAEEPYGLIEGTVERARVERGAAPAASENGVVGARARV